MDKVSDFFNEVIFRIKSMDRRYLYAILAIVFLLVSMWIYFANRNPSSAPQVALPTLLATPSLNQLPQTPTPQPSNLWTVKTLYEKKEVHFGFSSLVIDFENTTTKEIKKGHCQSPHDPAPIVGDTFILQNTTGDVWLFSPYDTTSQSVMLESKTQRFRLIP